MKNRADRASRWVRLYWIDLSCLGGLVLLSLVLRLPHLSTIPLFTDEAGEVSLALRVADGKTFPLTAASSYIGPLWIYLLALAFKLFGVSLDVPRALVMCIGVLTVLASYGLGKQLAHGDWRAGLVTGLLTATNAFHILYNSHVAWSAETTPLFVTLAAWTYLKGRDGENSKWLIAGGVFLGCAVQTHPFALFLVPAFAFDLLLTQRAARKIPLRAIGFALAAFLIVLSPLIVYNLGTSLDSFGTASTRSYAIETQPTLEKSIRNLGMGGVMLAHMFVGSFGQSTLESFLEFPVSALSLGVIAVVLIWLAWHKENLPLLAVASSLILSSIINRFYALPEASRYLAFLLPLIYAAFAVSLVHIYDFPRKRLQMPHNLMEIAWRGAVVACVLALAAFSLGSLAHFYKTETALMRTNDLILKILQVVSRSPKGEIWIDAGLENAPMGAGADLKTSFQYAFRLGRLKTRLVDFASASGDPLARLMQQGKTGYLITFMPQSGVLEEHQPLRELYKTQFLCRGCSSPVTVGLYGWDSP